MMRIRPVQMNFTAGEWSPRLFGRSDLSKYFNALESLENFTILPYGGVARRDGLHHVVDQGDGTRKARLIPFVFSTEQAYIIEAGHEYMRFYMNHGQIQEDADADTVLLLHCNGEDGSQTFTDSSQSAHTITAAGTAQVDTSYRKFGSGSLIESHIGAYLWVGDHADFDFSADDTFTIEANIRVQALHLGTIIMQQTDANNLFQLNIWNDGHVSFGVEHTSLWQLVDTAAGVITANTWHHIRVAGDGTNYYLFVDGALLVTAAIVKSFQNFTGPVIIGIMSGGANPFYGWIDELRISGVARSTATFPPPTQEFPLSVGTPYELATPYLEEDLPLMKVFQSYDTMYIFHPDHAWRKLTRTGHAAWALSVIDHTNGPWLEEETDITFTPTSTSGTVTVTASAAFFQAGHVGALLRLKMSGTWGYVKITVVSSDTVATATVVSELGSATGTTAYQEGPWLEEETDIAFVASGTTGSISLSTLLPFFTDSKIGTLLKLYINSAWGYVEITAVTSTTLATVTVIDTLGGGGAFSSTIYQRGEWLEESDEVTFTPSATTGSITITSDIDFFQDSHVDEHLRLNISGGWGYVQITAVTNSKLASATVIDTLGTASASSAYQEGAWSTYRGFPSSGAFNEGSLIAMANDNQPQTVWASKKGDYENFDVGTALDDEAFIYTVPASNRILWPGALRELVLGTGDGCYKMTGGTDDYISPTNVRVRPGMAIGAKNLGPIPVNNSLLYWQKGSRKLRELTYDPISYDEGYVAPDLSLLSDHMTLGGIKYSAWQQEPNSILWTVRTDGGLLGMTYMRPEDIVGWGRHITDGEIESVAVIPDPTDSFNEVWVSVKRTVLDVDSDTVLLLRMNGDDESTSFLDASASANVVTAHGDVKIDTALSKFGGSSGLFNHPYEGYLTIPDSADFDFSAGDIFTMEFWTYRTVLVSGGIISQTTDVNSWFHIFVWADGHISFVVTDTTHQIVDTAAGVLTAATWQHIRVVGDGTNYYIFVDGELQVTEAITHSMQNFTGNLTIGRNADASNYYGGWLDHLKVSKVARSTADFTPPASELKENRYIEYMDPDMMVDSGLIYCGAAVSSVSGLGHLEGKTVDIVADGVVYDQAKVTGGAVAIAPAASEIQVGLPYTSKLITMKPIINSEKGTTAGLPKKWAEIYVSVHETSGLTINDEVIDFRGFSTVALGEEIPLYTGNIQVSQLGWGDGRITLEHSDPLPCTILSIFGTLEVGN